MTIGLSRADEWGSREGFRAGGDLRPGPNRPLGGVLDQRNYAGNSGRSRGSKMEDLERRTRGARGFREKRKVRRRLLHRTLTEASGRVARSPEKGCESHFGLLRVSEMEDWKAEFDRCFRAQRRHLPIVTLKRVA